MTPEEIERFRRGDPELFRFLVEHHTPRLLALARPFASDAVEAEDLVQEVWVRAFARRSTWDGRGPLTAWLMAICRRVCLSDARRPARRRERRSGTAGTEVAVAELDGPREKTGRTPSATSSQPCGAAAGGGRLSNAPDALVERSMLGRAIRRALLELPERQRAVIVCRMLEGLSTRETAERLDCAEGTVKATLHAALGRLATPLRGWE